MADLRESFPTLEDGTGAGAPLRSVQEGDAVASKNGSLAFGFKDSTGNAIAPALDASGNVPVSATALPLPTGAATAANQATEIASLASIDSKLTSPITVTGPLTDAQLRATPVPVTFAAVVADGKRARGTVAGNASLTTVVSLALAVSKTYENLDFNVSCFRDARFQVILSDNGAETIVADAICGPGCTSFHGKLQEGEFATGASGTQLLLIKALNLNSLSDFYASLSVKLAN